MSREIAIRFGDQQRLFGVVTEPPDGVARSDRTALLLLNSGILHHAGPSCLYVSLARRLAAEGHLVLRFDFSGIGESEPRRDGMRFEESAVLEAKQAMDLLAVTRGAERFVVAGICSGGVMSLRVALADTRVAGAAMLNPQGYFASSSKRIESYIKAERDKSWLLTVSMRRRESWLRLVRGEVDFLALAKALAGRALRPLLEHGAARTDILALAREFERLAMRSVPMLHVYAEHDPGLIELDLVARAMPAAMRKLMQPHLVPGADHLFTPLDAQGRLVDLMRGFMLRSALGLPSAEATPRAASAPGLESAFS
jgi:pimeloyl-ACP methyl ester carboxylesterase